MIKKRMFIGLFQFLYLLFSCAAEEPDFVLPGNASTDQETFIYKSVDSINLEMKVFYPENMIAGKNYPAIVFFHGGGWRSGDTRQFEPHANYLSSRGMIGILANYRVSERHGTTPFDAVKDAKSAIRYVREHVDRMQINRNQIIAAGGSAGGHLAAAAGNIQGLEEPEENHSISSKPNALVLFNPVYDNGPQGYGYERIGNRYKEISPIHNISTGAPPTIVFFGTEDELVPMKTAKLYQKKMQDAGSRCDLSLYEGQGHAFFNYQYQKYYTETVYQTDRFLASLGYISGQPTIVREDFDYSLKKATEVTIRKGLPNFFKKIQNNQTVKVAYLGGSITQQPGWRVHSKEWMRNTYPQAEFEEIHASIGGTPSRLGVFRLENDVLKHDPDLLFVEFAVNDEGLSDNEIYKSMEGIVRKTWRHNPKTDICFVYTVKLSMLEQLQNGYFPRTASLMEEIAEHYGIPGIHFGVEITRLLDDGKIIFKGERPVNPQQKPMVFSSDGVHPFPETGHKLYNEAIIRSFKKMDDNADPYNHLLKEPFIENNYEHAALIPVNRDMLQGTWSHVNDTARNFVRNLDQKSNLPALWYSDDAGDRLTYTFTGKLVGIYDVIGPDCGKIIVKTDDQPEKEILRFDKYTVYHRLSYFIVDDNLDQKTHTVTITISNDSVDKASILMENRRDKYRDNPRMFEGNAWYPAALMVLEK